MIAAGSGYAAPHLLVPLLKLAGVICPQNVTFSIFLRKKYKSKMAISEIARDSSKIISPACRGQNSKTKVRYSSKLIYNNNGAMAPRELPFGLFLKKYVRFIAFSPSFDAFK